MARILVSDPLSDAGIALLRKAGHDVADRPGIKGEELAEAIGRADALIVRGATRVTAELIRRAADLRVIGRAGVGVDNIDIEAAEARGIEVLTAAEASTVTVAEHTLALLLALARRVPRAQSSIAAGKWERSGLTGFELAGKVLGLVGLGRIGSAVAERAGSFRMRIVGTDPARSPASCKARGIEWLPLDEVLSVSDVVSLHVPLEPGTRGLMDARALALMKPGAVLVNTSRGGVVCEAALLEALDSGRLAGAALDVFAEEPPKGSRLVGHPGVVATPHVGSQTVEAQERVALSIAEKVVAALLSGGGHASGGGGRAVMGDR
jgi:D-3-phosphoglycerate dehydrogenase